mmetsp:Transcript_16582/g.62748  ORF Transcript_16582/g.62748 Transcript_16582/m.62748 type:complete len:228 (+) Transcript_16582:4143-4826(+)
MVTPRHPHSPASPAGRPAQAPRTPDVAAASCCHAHASDWAGRITRALVPSAATLTTRASADPTRTRGDGPKHAPTAPAHTSSSSLDPLDVTSAPSPPTRSLSSSDPPAAGIAAPAWLNSEALGHAPSQASGSKTVAPLPDAACQRDWFDPPFAPACFTSTSASSGTRVPTTRASTDTPPSPLYSAPSVGADRPANRASTPAAAAAAACVRRLAAAAAGDWLETSMAF